MKSIKIIIKYSDEQFPETRSVGGVVDIHLWQKRMWFSIEIPWNSL